MLNGYSLEHFLNPLRSCFLAIVVSLVQTHQKFSTGLIISYVNTRKLQLLGRVVWGLKKEKYFLSHLLNSTWANKHISRDRLTGKNPILMPVRGAVTKAWKSQTRRHAGHRGDLARETGWGWRSEILKVRIRDLQVIEEEWNTHGR